MGSASAQDNTLVFGTKDAGVSKAIDLWGLDTAWLSSDNVRRGVIYMGKPQTDLIRFSFTGDWPIVNGALSAGGQSEFDQRMAIVNAYTDSHTKLILNNDTSTLDASYNNGDGVNAYNWAQLIDVTRADCVAAGRTVLAVEPFNEPDNSTWQGTVTRFGDVCWQLRWSTDFQSHFTGIDIFGGNTLNDDVAASWYNTLNGWGYVEGGNTHQLAGSFDNYAAFHQTVAANGDLGVNDELHNVMEAMVGAEYGMDIGIWWGTAERARGEFVKSSDGVRLAYAENRPNWTAASVYRAPSGKVQAFIGESERQAVPTTYRFVCKDRPVFYDGNGPQRMFDVTTTGDPNHGYQTANDHNAERVVDIQWGDDVQPAIAGRYYLVNRNSLKVMEVPGSSITDGTNLQQNTYGGTGATNQQWDVNPMASTSGGDYSYYSVLSASSGKAADVYNFSNDDGGVIDQWAIGTYANVNQQWFLEYAGNGWFYVRSRWSGLYLAVAGASTSTGANIVQKTGDNSFNEQWRLVPVGADPADVTAPNAPTGLAATANAVSVRLTWNANTESDLGGYTILRSTVAGGPYEIIARGVASNSFTDNSANQNSTYYYVVRAVDKSLNQSGNSAQVSATPTAAATLAAQYQFEGNLTDASGNQSNAIGYGTVSYGSGAVGSSGLNLNGQNAYLVLPADVANYRAITIATWVCWNGGNAWQRIFDFGNSTGAYLFLTPSSGSGTLRFAITTGGGGAEQTLNASGPLVVGQWMHVAVTLDGTSAQLYLNGSQVASLGTTLKPSDFSPVVNYIGKSQYAGDPLFNGSIDDFRIYNYALTSSAISALVSGGNSVYYKFSNRATGLYIDGMGRTTNGSDCGQSSGSSSTNQQWAIVPAGAYVRLKNRGTGLFLDGMGRTKNGSAAGQWSDSTSNNQQWQETSSGGYIKFVNRATGLCLDGMGSTTSGAALDQWASSTSNNQQWTLQQAP